MASSRPPKSRITPRRDSGEELEEGRHGVSQQESGEEDQYSEHHQRAARASAEPDMPRHASGAVAHGDAPDARADEVHDAVVDCHGPDGDRAIGEERVVLLDGGDDRVAERQRHLGEPEDQHARGHVLPAQTSEGEVRQPGPDADAGKLGEDPRLSRQRRGGPERQEHEHRGDPLVGEEHEGQGHRGDGEEPVALRQLDALEHQAEPEPEHEALDDRPAGEARDPRHRAGHAHEKPEGPGEETGREDRARRDDARVGDGGGADGLHRLDRDRRPEVESHEDLEDPERHEHAHRVHLAHGEVPDQERDERAEVAEGAGQLADVVRVAAARHGVSTNAVPARRDTAACA